MPTFIERLWNFFSSPGLTIVLAFLICIDSAWGSILTIASPEFYEALDHAVLLGQLIEVGWEAPALVLWIYILIFLIFLFAINTVVCSTARVYSIIRSRRPWASFLPQLIHLGFLVALIGHLIGSVSGFKTQGNIYVEGEPAAVPNADGLFLRLDGVDAVRGVGGMMESLEVGVTLLVQDGDGRMNELKGDSIEINSPLMYRGINFYHESNGETIDGYVLDVGGLRTEVRFGGEFTALDGTLLRLGRLYNDLAFDSLGRAYSRSNRFNNPYQVVIDPDGKREFLSVAEPGGSVVLGSQTIGLIDFLVTDYVVLTIHRDPGIWFIIAGSLMLVVGMVAVLVFSPERAELVREDHRAGPSAISAAVIREET